MSLDFEKINSEEFKKDLQEKALKELSEQIPEALIQFSANNIIEYCFSKKRGLRGETSPRVLNNWINKGIIKVDESDKGKVKRFDKIESIWLNIVVELREFGLSLEIIEKIRANLFNEVCEGFSLLRFQVLRTILTAPNILLIYKNGDVKVSSQREYNKLNSKPYVRLIPSLNFSLTEFIEYEYPNHSLYNSLELPNLLESPEKMKLMYFLKTGDYQSIKIKLSDGDVRYIENMKMILKNEEILKSLGEWNFEEILISIDDEYETIITPKK